VVWIRLLREMAAARKWRRTARVAVAYASNARFQLMYIVQFSHMEESQCWVRKKILLNVRETPCDVTARRGEYIRAALGAERVVLIDWDPR
ncbi:hypothetical protein AVEN_156049-1, partial [Araneus ventricosus]